MKKVLKQLPLLLIMICLLILPYFVFAESPLDRLEKISTGGDAGGGPYAPTDENSLAVNAGSIINAAFGLLGAVFIILIILAGFSWMTAEGNDEKISKSKDRLKSAIIGLIIILASYSIWKLLAEKLIFG